MMIHSFLVISLALRYVNDQVNASSDPRWTNRLHEPLKIQVPKDGSFQ